MSTVKKVASSNWLALQKTLKKRPNPTSSHPRKRRKLDYGSSKPTKAASLAATTTAQITPTVTGLPTSVASSTLITLRNMIQGSLIYTPSQSQPGKYLAIDCEMVGIGTEGSESSLARVSIVNWYGAIQLDVYVQQRERVVDYRTQWSGIREKNMVGAKPFDQVQKMVADSIKDRILVGHAVHNDLKVLLLSHPRPMLRDTQLYARKFNLTKSKRIALRNLVKDQIGITIQETEHDSVADARATMAIYRLHKNDWEKDSVRRPQIASSKSKNTTTTATLTVNAENNPVPESNTTTKKRRRSEPTKGKAPAASDDVESDPDSDSGSNATSSSLSTSKKTNAILVSKLKAPLYRPQKPPPNQKQHQNPSSGISTIIKRRIPNTTSLTKTVHSQGKAKSTTSSSSSDRKSVAGTRVGRKEAWWTKPPSWIVNPGVGGSGGGVTRKKSSFRLSERTS